MPIGDSILFLVLILLIGGPIYILWRRKKNNKGQSACLSCPYAKDACGQRQD